MEYFKVFEDITRKSLEAEQAIVDRLPDQMSGNLGSVNPGDFLAYKYPNLYYIECKSCTQPVFDIKSHISESQWLVLLRKARLEFPGVYVGYLLWFTESHKVFWISAKNMKIIYGKQKSFSVADLESSLSLYAIPIRLKFSNTQIKTPKGYVARFVMEDLLLSIQVDVSTMVKEDKIRISDLINFDIAREYSVVITPDDVTLIHSFCSEGFHYLVYKAGGFDVTIWVHIYNPKKSIDRTIRLIVY